MRDFAEQGNSKCWSSIGYLALLAPLEFLELAALLHFWRLAGLRILRIRHQQFHMCEKNVVGCNLLKLMGDSGVCRYSGHRRYVRSHTQAIVATAANAAACCQKESVRRHHDTKGMLQPYLFVVSMRCRRQVRLHILDRVSVRMSMSLHRKFSKSWDRGEGCG